MTMFLFTLVEITDCVTFLDRATLRNGTSSVQQRFGKLGFSSVAWADQAYVANVSCCISHIAVYLPRLRNVLACRGRAISIIPNNRFNSTRYGQSPDKNQGLLRSGFQCLLIGPDEPVICTI